LNGSLNQFIRKRNYNPHLFLADPPLPYFEKATDEGLPIREGKWKS